MPSVHNCWYSLLTVTVCGPQTPGQRRISVSEGSSVSEHDITIGELIRRRRRMLRLNQTTTAQTIGVNQSTVTKWERGERPRDDNLPAIARFLDLPIAEVLSVVHGTTADDEAEVTSELRELRREIKLLRGEVARLYVKVESLQPLAAPARRRRSAN